MLTRRTPEQVQEFMLTKTAELLGLVKKGDVAIAQLTMERDAARALVVELSERVFKQSELLGKRAAKAQPEEV